MIEPQVWLFQLTIQIAYSNDFFLITLADDGLLTLTFQAYRRFGWMCRGDVERCESVGLPYLWRTTRINSFSELGVGCKISWTNFFITPAPRELLWRNFYPVNKITLGIFLGQNHTTSITSGHVEITHFETWS